MKNFSTEFLHRIKCYKCHSQKNIFNKIIKSTFRYQSVRSGLTQTHIQVFSGNATSSEFD